MNRLLLTLMGFLLCSMALFAQNRTITGKVRNEDGSPIANASVKDKGSNIGTTTKADGTFSLSLPLNAGPLVISAAGRVTQELPITVSTATAEIILERSIQIELGETTVTVVEKGDLEMDDAQIVVEDLIAIPYGTANRSSFTGSFGHIKSKQFYNRPLTNVTTAIEGMVPGVITRSQNGQPGSGPDIRIRGFGTINASAQPLLVVDGVPYIGDISNINSADVESMTVLKDAVGSALYGSRGGNGVIMLTTKKGRKGHNRISARISQGVVSRGLPEYDQLDARQYYPIMWEAYRNSLLYPIAGTGISPDSANRVASGLTARPGIADQLSYNPFNVAGNAIVGTDGQLNPSAQLLYGDDLDWTKELLRRGARSDYYLNFNGGGEKNDYLLSLGYVNEKGYLLNSDFKRYSARLNVNVEPASWLKTGLNVFANHTEANITLDTGSTSLDNPFFFTRNIGPIYPVYAHNMTTGEYLLDTTTNQRFWDLGNMGGGLGVPNRTSGGLAGRHPLAEAILDKELLQRTSISARNFQEIKFLTNFRFVNNLSVDYQVQNNNSYNNPIVGEGAPVGRAQKENIASLAFIASQVLHYNNNSDVHRLDIMAGHESFNQKNTVLSGSRQGQTVSGSIELGNFSTINFTNSFVDRYKIESYFARVNYELDGKYFLSGNLRRDGNSIFSPDSRWGTFWSFGAGWNLSNENFLSNVRWLDLLKLRASYGKAGVSDGTGSRTSFGFYAYQGLYNFLDNANEPGIIQNQHQALMNASLKWEDNKQANVGLDFYLFKSRISGSVEYFQRTSSDLLFAVPQPLSSGVLTIIQNAATVKNSGIEIQLSGDIVRSKSFLWNATVNLSTLTNEITELHPDIPEFVTGTKKYAVGQSVYDYWLPTFYGVDSADGAALYKAANTLTVSNRRIKDNKSGGADTLTILASNALYEYQGTAIPDFYGSFSQSLSYKGFTLNALLTFQLGGKTYDANYQGLMSSGTYGSALSSDILNRWQKPGDNTTVPRMDAGRTTDFNTASSRWLVDASYVNIRMVSLGYSLPTSLISRWDISNVQLFISGENLGFFSKRKGLNNHQHFSGVTSNAYSPATIISAGITLNR